MGTGPGSRFLLPIGRRLLHHYGGSARVFVQQWIRNINLKKTAVEAQQKAEKLEADLRIYAEKAQKEGVAINVPKPAAAQPSTPAKVCYIQIWRDAPG